MTYIGPKYLKNLNKEKAAKLKKPTMAARKKKLQERFNLMIRLRDTEYSNGQAFFICISCQEPKDTSQMNAGHLFPVGSNESIRYEEDNCWGQCVKCNLHLHGNQLEMYKNVLKKIGEERMNRLDMKRRSLLKLLPFELDELLEKVESKIAELKKKKP